jgi:hypothetical protein
MLGKRFDHDTIKVYETFINDFKFFQPFGIMIQKVRKYGKYYLNYQNFILIIWI